MLPPPPVPPLFNRHLPRNSCNSLCYHLARRERQMTRRPVSTRQHVDLTTYDRSGAACRGLKKVGRACDLAHVARFRFSFHDAHAKGLSRSSRLRRAARRRADLHFLTHLIHETFHSCPIAKHVKIARVISSRLHRLCLVPNPD